MGSYQAVLLHLMLIQKLYCSMEPLVGYSPDKSRNMVLMGGLSKYIPITRTTFLWGTLSLCGIPPLVCLWSKDEILSNSWLYLPFFGIIASFTAGLIAFYIRRDLIMALSNYYSLRKLI
uniref:NADH:quinone oxidoreductase/Mrp antiporter transmembrane domain-containing protein n=1 Tax=Aegilops tauschii subsp. strangulata TaxID=200361 RepID=A0A453PSC3_AEGTS